MTLSFANHRVLELEIGPRQGSMNLPIWAKIMAVPDGTSKASVGLTMLALTKSLVMAPVPTIQPRSRSASAEMRTRPPCLPAEASVPNRRSDDTQEPVADGPSARGRDSFSDSRTGASSPRPLYLTECLLIGPKENAA